MSPPTSKARTLPQLRLDVIAGPPEDAVIVEPGDSIVIGRSSACDRRLPDPSVSRRHCRISPSSEFWLLTDLGSRHGTYVNGQRLTHDTPTPIERGDTVSLGPWTFRAKIGGLASQGRPTTNAVVPDTEHVETVFAGEMESLARHRLDLLLNCAATLNTAKNETDLANSIIETALEGTGFPRASVIQRGEGEGQVEVLAWRDSSSRSAEELTFSRSLLEAASSGEVARLTAQSVGDQAHSVIQLGIQSALCAPIHLGPTIAAYLYLDARRTEADVQPDAAAFCQALARLYGLALSNLKRADLEIRHFQFVRDIEAAQEAQRLIFPKETGEFMRLRYAVRVKSGRHVAGDLFGVTPVSETRTAFFIGDVTGKGVGAGIMMVATQTYLTAAIGHNATLAEAVTEANRFLSERMREGQFVSLWVGLVDQDRGTLTYVDAGHGHCLLAPRGEAPGALTSEGGLPIGVLPDEEYDEATIEFGTGNRLVLFSDGIVEQRNREEEQFGMERICEAIRGGGTPEEDVARLFEAVVAFAETEELADDATVASITLG